MVLQNQKNRKLRLNFERYALQNIGKHKLQILMEEVSAEVGLRQKVQFGESEYIAMTRWPAHMKKNSLGRFMAAFSGGAKLSKKEAEELRHYLEDVEE